MTKRETSLALKGGEEIPLVKRLTDLNRWKTVAYDTFLGFMIGALLLMVLRDIIPGRFNFVTTESIKRGVYWLDMRPQHFHRGDFTTFKYNPKEDWLIERYQGSERHTKRVAAVEGDTISVDKDLKITACHAEKCEPLGAVQRFDSQNRPMKSWVAPGTTYRLKEGEVWVHGHSERSLDSRYHGPVALDELEGKAHPLFLFD